MNRPPLTPLSESNIPLELLRLLAAGLIQLADEAENRPLRVPYPTPWQRALNRLAALYLDRGKCLPADLPDALALCRSPLRQWELVCAELEDRAGDSLLDPDLDEPTELCRELAEGLPEYGVETELNERSIAQLRERAQQLGLPDAYIFLRRYLIQHPVVSERDRVLATFASELSTLGGLLDSFYEPVPQHAIENGRMRLCGHCGWTVTWRHGRLECGGPRCRLLTREFSRGTKFHTVRAGEMLRRVRPAIRRYVVSPGVYEIRLFEELKALGFAVELWPGYDRYDLRLVLPATARHSAEVWGLDVKDWRAPGILAAQLSLPGQAGAPGWDRFFYVVPDDRLRGDPHYLSTLQRLTKDRGFDVISTRSLLRQVRARVQSAAGSKGAEDAGLE